MKCQVCRHGETRLRQTTVTLERNGAVLVIRKVPAEVCENRAEPYARPEVTRRLLESAHDILRAGVVVDISEFAATSV